MVADLRDLRAGHPYYDRDSPLLARLRGRALAQAAAVVTVTEGCRDNLLKLHPELARAAPRFQERLRPCPLRPSRRAADTHGSPPTLIFAGALYGDHTAEALVAALAVRSSAVASGSSLSA